MWSESRMLTVSQLLSRFPRESGQNAGAARGVRRARRETSAWSQKCEHEHMFAYASDILATPTSTLEVVQSRALMIAAATSSGALPLQEVVRAGENRLPGLSRPGSTR